MIRLVITALLGVFGAGCLTEADETMPVEEIGTAGGALTVANALNMNALNMNALNMNALNMNALNMNALSPASLAALQSPSAEGDLARQLVEYAVGCALNSTGSFSLSWTDASNVVHKNTYWGVLGLAPRWTSNPLTFVEQQWVSACLASRVNWYMTPVLLSSRGGSLALNHPSAGELAAFTKNEGAFWGNLFGPSPAVYACYNAPNVGYSRSKSRDCAAGHVTGDGSVVGCGILQIVGSCSDLCDPLDSAGVYYPACGVAPVGGGDPAGATAKTPIVVSVFLK